MAKIVIIFFAALAFQATLARTGLSQEQLNREVQDLLKQLQSIGVDAVSAVENVQVEGAQSRRLLASQANELAHSVHDAAYHLQQVVHHNQGGQGQQVLQQVVSSLSDIVHSLQQALNSQPDQLKAQLKSQLQNVVAQAQKLGPVVQQQQHSQHVNIEVGDIIDDLVTAVHQVQVRNRLQGQSQEQIKSQAQEVTNQVSNVIQSVSSDDESTAEELAHHAHRLAHHVGHVVHNLQREVHNHDGEVRNVLQQVINKLSEIHASLEQAGLSEENDQVSELKNQLKTNVHNVAVQVERLVRLVHSNSSDEHAAQDLRNVVQVVLARSLVAARQLQRDVEATVQNHQ